MPRPAPVADGLSLPSRRLAAQQLAGSACATPAKLVAWFGAIQAQDLAGARWAVGLRLHGAAAEADVERALAEGSVLRTHALRGTWHLVAPGDLRSLLALGGPRVLAGLARRHRQLGLDAAALRASRAAIARALRGGHQTREELAAALASEGVPTEGGRLSHLLALAELEAVACSGAPRERRQTYAAFDERVPAPRGPFDRDEALARLARCYIRSRGPATADDLAWWSGLTRAESRRGLEANGRALVEEEVEGRAVWFAADAHRAAATPPPSLLLPAFDEYLVAYRDRDAVLDPRQARRVNAGGGMLDPVVVVGGRVVGTWRRELGRDGVAVQVELFGASSAPVRAAVVEAARRYGAFLGREPAVTFSRPGRGPGLPRRSKAPRPRGPSPRRG